MYESLIVAIIVAIFGGALNILYEKKFADSDFVVTKKLLLNRLGMSAVAGGLVFYGLADAATTSFDLVALAQDFGLTKVADFAAFAVPFAASGYFADDVVDVFWDKMKKKFSPGDVK